MSQCSVFENFRLISLSSRSFFRDSRMPLWRGRWVGVEVFSTLPNSKLSHVQALNCKLCFFCWKKSSESLSVSKNNKTGWKNKDPAWQSTPLQTTGYELCNKNSITTNVWKTKEAIDTGPFLLQTYRMWFQTVLSSQNPSPNKASRLLSKMTDCKILPSKDFMQDRYKNRIIYN